MPKYGEIKNKLILKNIINKTNEKSQDLRFYEPG